MRSASRLSPAVLDTPLASWFESDGALKHFRRNALGRKPAVLSARDRAWQALAPDFAGVLAMAASGLPFQVAANRRYDRSGDPGLLPGAIRAGATIFLPQIHQVLPRVSRLMVALRVALLGAHREESSFLFLVEGRGRPGMGLHHDGDVDAFWIQLEGTRTVTVGPPVPRGTPPDIATAAPVRDPGWATLDLEPGSLFSLPPRTPHDVVCHARSLALSFTWACPRRRRRRLPWARAASLTRWDVASGQVSAMPARRRGRLWTQVPVLAGPLARDRGTFALWTPNGTARLPADWRPAIQRLALMPAVRPHEAGPAPARRLLMELGILAPYDLPLRILPENSKDLDGWEFA